MASNAANNNSDIQNKYKTTLNALIEQNFNVINDVYLDMFITHASGKKDEGNNIINFLPSLSHFHKSIYIFAKKNFSVSDNSCE